MHTPVSSLDAILSYLDFNDPYLEDNTKDPQDAASGGLVNLTALLSNPTFRRAGESAICDMNLGYKIQVTARKIPNP